jgi:hypothetical protein
MTDHTISFQADPGLIRISIHGIIDDSAAHSITTEAINLAGQNKCTRFLYDLREAGLKMTITELYLLPRDFKVSMGHKVAALIKQNDLEEKWRFLETVERNFGITMQVFFDENEAIDWLTKS